MFLFLVVCLQITFLFSILRLCFSGIDFTDEGKYLNDSFSPSSSSDSVTHYGYVYHQVFKALNYNVPTFRVFNVLTTFLLACIASHRSLKMVSTLSGVTKLSISISIGLISLSFLSVYWLPTPSYNSLTLQSLLLCWIFYLNYLEKPAKYLEVLNSICLAISCVILFLGKPSSFLLMHLIAFVFVLIHKGIIAGLMNIVTHITIVTSFLFLVSAIIYRSPVEILHRVFNGYQNANLLTKGNYTLSGFFENAKLNNRILLSFAVVLISIVLIRFQELCSRENIESKNGAYLATLFLFSICALMTYFAKTSTLSMFLFLIPISLAYTWACATSRRNMFNERVGYLTFLTLLPIVGAAGTASNLFFQSQIFFVFIILFFTLITANRTNHRNSDLILPFIAICLVCLTAVVLYVAAKTPYRQASSLFSNNYELSDDSTVRNLLVDYGTFKSYSTMVKVVGNSGFKSGDGLIDLTGQSPTISFLIGAKPIGETWLLGGYSGSNDFAIKKLHHLSCKEKVSSYLLVEPGGPLSLDERYVLASIGLDYAKYLPAANWTTPKGAGGFIEERRLFLLKPNYLKDYCSQRS